MAYRTEIEKLEQRYAENPKQWFAALADAYRKQGDVDLAIEYVTGGIEDRPDYASAHIVLGRCYLDKNMDDHAANAFEQVLGLDAENIVALKSLEEIAERKGDTVGAREWLKRLLEVDPMNEEAHENLARLEAEEKAKDPSPEAEGLAPEVLTEEEAVDEQESAPAEMMDEAVPPELILSEDVVDASSVEVEPMVLDATMPLDGEIGSDSAIAPFEVETEDSDAISLLSAAADDDESAVDDAVSVAPFGSIELEAPGADADSLLAGIQGSAEFLDEEDDGPTAELEPIELETPAEDANSLLSRISEEVEPPAVLEETKSEVGALELDKPDVSLRATFAEDLEPPDELAELDDVEGPEELEEPAGSAELEDAEGPEEPEEPAGSVELEDAEGPEEPEEAEELAELAESAGSAELEGAEELEELEKSEDIAATEETVEEVESAEEAAQRLSVPPTKEVDAVDLEAMRSVDELIARPTLDDVVLEDDGGYDEEEDEEEDEELGDAIEAQTIDEPAEELMEEVPRTREIDAVELQKLRIADALVVGSPPESMIPDGDEDGEQAIEAFAEPELVVEPEPLAEHEMLAEQEPLAEHEMLEEPEPLAEPEALAEPEPLIESRWDVEDTTEVQDADETEEQTASIYDSDADADVLPLIMPEEAGEGEASPDAEPEPVVTETMAEVYAKQGLYEQAREIYEVLVMQHGDDARLKARLNELNVKATSAIQETRQSRFSVTVTGGESTVTYLQRMFTYDASPGFAEVETGVATAQPEARVDAEGDMLRTPLEEAFADDPPEVPGEPTVVAADDVSLESVFDGGALEPTSTENAGDVLDQVGEEPVSEDGVSFDEFYGSEPRPSLPDATGSPSDEKPADDDDSFKDWLKGLKT